MKRTLMKSPSDKALFGVCGGIAEFFGISSTVVRIIFLFTPFHFFIYFALAYSLKIRPDYNEC